MAAGTDDKIRVATRIIVRFENHHKKHLSNRAAGLAIRGFIVFRSLSFAARESGCVAPVQHPLLT